MFEEYNKIYIKQDMQFRNREKKYSLMSDQRVIGTIEVTPESTKDIGNQLLKLITLYNIVSFELSVVDRNEKVLGVIKKEKGFYKDFLLYTKDNEHVATIKPTVKVKSPMMTVMDANGNELFKAVGGYGATDFSVVDSRTDKQISTIKKRSLIYETIKENLLNDDGYYIDNTAKEPLITLSLLAMGVLLDVYFFNR